MDTKTRQRGMSTIGVLLIIVVVLFFGMLALKLFPVYYDSFAVSSIFSEVGQKAHSDSAREIRATLERRFEVNNIDEQISVKNVKIKSNGHGGMDVSLHYERRVPFIGNLDLIATFDEHTVVKKR